MNYCPKNKILQNIIDSTSVYLSKFRNLSNCRYDNTIYNFLNDKTKHILHLCISFDQSYGTILVDSNLIFDDNFTPKLKLINSTKTYSEKNIRFSFKIFPEKQIYFYNSHIFVGDIDIPEYKIIYEQIEEELIKAYLIAL
jgi:hypothetical protein